MKTEKLLIHKLKMRNTFRILILGLLFPLASLAQKDNEIERKISKSYDVSSNDELSIANKYGEVLIETWDKNQITVDIQIKAWGRSSRDAQKLMDQIEIDEDSGSGDISFETEVHVNNVKINKHEGFEINYKVNMPKRNSLNLANKYGYTYLADIEGDLNLEVSYGKLKARRILSRDADLEIKYSSAEIDEIVRGDLEGKYSKPIEIEKVGELDFDCKYGGLKIEEADVLDGSFAYTGMTVGTLHKSIRVGNKYGSGRIDEVKAGFSDIDIDSSYGSFDLDFDSNAKFEFEIETRYGNFRSDMSNLDIRKEIKRSFTAYEYEGVANGGGGGRVRASTSYGDIKIR